MNVVKVTQKDIDGGVPGRAKNCPITIALRREFKGSWMVICDAYSSKGKIYLGRKARKFISRFDNGLPVKPFSFSATMKPYEGRH